MSTSAGTSRSRSTSKASAKSSRATRSKSAAGKKPAAKKTSAAGKKPAAGRKAPRKAAPRKAPAAQDAQMAAAQMPPALDDMLKFDCEEGSAELPAPKVTRQRGFAAAAAPTNWRMSKALELLRSQINVLAPNRSKLSDGGIGDPAHQQRGSASDHNPWVVDGGTGVVTARDFTHDKKNGCDCDVLAESLRTARDPRLKYVIWNSRIFSSEAQGAAAAWEWRPYTGVNKHNKHMHISVKSAKPLFDGTSAWVISVA